MAVATSALMAQTTTTTVVEEPDRIQMKSLSKDPSGQGIPTGYEMPQAVAQKKHECKDHKDGQPCTKPADQQCDDCKAKAAAAEQKHECKKAEGQQCEKAAGMKHECKKGEGQQCEKAAGMKHECKKAEDQQCEKAAGMKHDCKKGEGQQCEKAAGMKHECKDHKDGQPCTKPADQQCDDCKNAAGQKNAPKKVQGMKIAGSKKTSLQNSSSKEPVKISEKKK